MTNKPRDHYINISHSNGVELSLFNRQYTIWLSCKRKDYKKTVKDAEFIETALNNYQALLEQAERMAEALEHYQSAHYTLSGVPCFHDETATKTLKQWQEFKK